MRYRIPHLSAGAMGILCLISASASGAAPTDNPVGAYYSGGEGYPAWTDRIRWASAINMKTYAKGKTDSAWFENARDELAAKGGGVLYYPAGTKVPQASRLWQWSGPHSGDARATRWYDFSVGPMDGPHGRGLMLPDCGHSPHRDKLAATMQAMADSVLDAFDRSAGPPPAGKRA